MPTVLGLMGLSDRIPGTVAGRDFSRELLTDDWSGQSKPQSALFLGYNNKIKGVRTDRHSFQIDEDGGQFVWDNIDDPYQMHPKTLDDLEASESAFLLSELARWLKDSRDPWYLARKFDQVIPYPVS
jgi:hypothetical protein